MHGWFILLVGFMSSSSSLCSSSFIFQSSEFSSSSISKLWLNFLEATPNVWCNASVQTIWMFSSESFPFTHDQFNLNIWKTWIKLVSVLARVLDLVIMSRLLNSTPSFITLWGHSQNYHLWIIFHWPSVFVVAYSCDIFFCLFFS
jgi:hypothetical protein